MRKHKLNLLFVAFLGVAIMTGCSTTTTTPIPQAYKHDSSNGKYNYEIVKPNQDRNFSEKNLSEMIKNLEGRPYVWAEEGPYCFDCSGYIYYMFGKMGVEIPRVAREQYKIGQPVAYEDLQFGDLLFFDTSKRKTGKITHVGIYLKNGWFSQASSSHKQIIYSNLNTDTFYKDRLIGARRYYSKTDDKYVMTLQPYSHYTTATRLADTSQNKNKSVENNIKIASTETINNTPIVATNLTVAPKKIATVKPTITSNVKKSYYVQVGNFHNAPKKDFLNEIKSKGFAYTIMPVDENGKVTSKILIGPFKNNSEASNKLNSIKQDIEKAAFVTKVDS